MNVQFDLLVLASIHVVVKFMASFYLSHYGKESAETQEIASGRLAVTGVTTAHLSRIRLVQVACKDTSSLHAVDGPGSSVCIATDYGLDGPGSNPVGDEIFRPSRPVLGAHPASCTMGTGSFAGVKCGRGVLLTTHPLLVPRSWKSRTIPLPTLWTTPGL